MIMFSVAALSLLLVCGCTSQIGIAPCTTPITANDTYTVIGHAKGSTSGFWILWFPFFSDDPSGRARDDAIEKSGGDALIEVVEEYNALSLLIVSFAWTNCEGTAIKINRGGRK
jgi:hypothetical protein